MTDSLLPDRLPDGWRGARLRWVSRIYAGGTPSRERPEYWQEGTIPWLNSGAVNDRVINEPSEYITAEGLAGSSARWIPALSVVMALAGQGKTKGTAARLEIETTCNQSMAALVPGQALDYRFLHFWLVANYERIRNLGGGDLRDGLNLQMVGDIEVPLPPVEEQRRIADFLDDQVARIESLKSARQVQADLAREHMDAWLIRTFLGPAHDRTRVRALIVDERLGAWGEEPTEIDDVHVARVADFDRDRYRLTQAPTMRHMGEAQVAPRLLRPGDVLLERSGGGDDKPVGFAVLFAPDYQGRTVTSNFVSRLRPRESTDPSYLRYVLAAMYQARWNAAHYTQTTGIQNLKSESYLRSDIPLVSADRQHHLANEGDAAVASLGAHLDLAERAAQLLEERKRSLITAAVTGEMDVTTARPINMGRWVPGVGADVASLAPTTAPSLGGM